VRIGNWLRTHAFSPAGEKGGLEERIGCYFFDRSLLPTGAFTLQFFLFGQEKDVMEKTKIAQSVWLCQKEEEKGR
jgi:hypothetical protein